MAAASPLWDLIEEKAAGPKTFPPPALTEQSSRGCLAPRTNYFTQPHFTISTSEAFTPLLRTRSLPNLHLRLSPFQCGCGSALLLWARFTCQNNVKTSKCQNLESMIGSSLSGKETRNFLSLLVFCPSLQCERTSPFHETAPRRGKNYFAEVAPRRRCVSLGKWMMTSEYPRELGGQIFITS